MPKCERTPHLVRNMTAAVLQYILHFQLVPMAISESRVSLSKRSSRSKSISKDLGNLTYLISPLGKIPIQWDFFQPFSRAGTVQHSSDRASVAGISSYGPGVCSSSYSRLSTGEARHGWWPRYDHPFVSLGWLIFKWIAGILVDHRDLCVSLDVGDVKRHVKERVRFFSEETETCLQRHVKIYVKMYDNVYVCI